MGIYLSNISISLEYLSPCGKFMISQIGFDYFLSVSQMCDGSSDNRYPLEFIRLTTQNLSLYYSPFNEEPQF